MMNKKLNVIRDYFCGYLFSTIIEVGWGRDSSFPVFYNFRL